MHQNCLLTALPRLPSWLRGVEPPRKGKEGREGEGRRKGKKEEGREERRKGGKAGDR